jgi:hypothetical protein
MPAGISSEHGPQPVVILVCGSAFFSMSMASEGPDIMRPSIAAIVVLSVLALPAGVRSAPTEQTFVLRTTGDLADLCAYTSASDPMMTAAQNFCQGFMVGVYQVLQLVDAARAKPAFCIPTPPPTRTEAIAAFVQWAKANPSETARPPVDGVFGFLTQRFPCPAKP